MVKSILIRFTFMYFRQIYFFLGVTYAERCAAKHKHRRPENKGELLTTSNLDIKYQTCILPFIFAGR